MANAEIIVKIIDQTKGGLNSVKENLDGVAKSGKGASDSIFSVANALKAAATSAAVTTLVKFGSEVQNIENRLKLLNPSLGTTSENFNRVLQIANDTQQPLAATADLYQKVARSADQYGLSAGEVGKVTQTFANLLKLAGADAAAADGSIRQLGQALGSGALRGDEFNSIVEATAGEILPLLAKEMGVSIGQVRALAGEGKITGDVLLNALGKGADEVGSRVGNMSVTIGGAITKLQNNLLALGREGAPAFDAIAAGIELLADNLDGAIMFATAFIAALAVGKLYAIVTGLGGISAAFATLTTVMQRNPVVLFATAAAAAITAIYVYWDDLKLYAERAFIGIQIGYQRFVIGFTEAMEDAINYVGRGFVSFKDNVVGIFAGLGAALLDPLNAVDAFNKAMQQSVAESTANASIKIVDFSSSLTDNKQRLSELEQQLVANSTALNDNTKKVESNTGAVGNNWREIQKTVGVYNSLDEIYNQAGGKLNKFNADLTQQIELARLDSKEKAQQVAAYKAIEAAMEDATKSGKKLSAEQIKQIEERTVARVKELQTVEEQRKKEEELLKDRVKFEEEAQNLIRQMTRETMTEVQKIEEEKQRFIAEARRLGVADHRSTQDAILSYDEKIKREQVKLEDELRKERQKAINDTVSEYSSLYGFLGDELSNLTGVSRKQFGIIRDVTKIMFGTDINQIFKETFATAVGGVQGFGGAAATTMKQVSAVTKTEMDATGGGITSMLSTSLDNMGDFVLAVFNNFKTLGGGIIEILGTAFEWLTGGFSSVFGGLSSFISGFFGNIGNMIGGINFKGFQDDFITQNTAGFYAKGGFIPPGDVGIVGEAGPEIVSGPANVMSAANSAEMLGGSNITINISTIDAMGFDELLTRRRDVITDLVRTAIEERPSRTLRGVY